MALPHSSLASLFVRRPEEDIIDDHELAHRKAQQAAWRRYEATEWLRKMDYAAAEALSEKPSEEEFCIALRNGLILCNVLNKINPGAIPKVVENPIVAVETNNVACAPQSVIQYFENTRNFLVAVEDMKLLTFDASDLEKGGSSIKVVDCILCLKGYHEWKETGGFGIWRYGGTVKIVSLQNDRPTLDAPSLEMPKELDALTLLFDRFALDIVQNNLTHLNDTPDVLSKGMVIDSVLKKVVKDFTAFLVSHSNELGILLKDVLQRDCCSISKLDFIEAISKYLARRYYGVSNDLSSFCICGGKRQQTNLSGARSDTQVERFDLQQKQLEVLKSAFQMTKAELKDAQANWENEIRRLGLHIKTLEVASASYNKLLDENRLLYNQVQDLKGSIRVFCRVRPFLPGETDGKSVVDYIGENGDIMILNPHKKGKDARKVFSFNKVFGANATQRQVFADTRALIRSVLDGYNVCIFAYGQTGSGKTYTMNGPDIAKEETWGVNYRALNDLFEMTKSRRDLFRYDVRVQMIEIYNEQVRDLLLSGGAQRRLDICNISQPNGLNVPDASLSPVKCVQDVLDLMQIGQKNRSVGATALNERSSRSHSVLAVHVIGKELLSGSILKSCLHLVDLAGSERVDKSEAVGERLREAQNINRSLSALGDVISALAQKSKHIPYRNSKLTQVLQDSLGGQAKTMMFVHINPELNSYGETISTLKFAERVASIELGAAHSNKETGDIRVLKDEISDLKLALASKEAEMEQLKGGNLQIQLDSQKQKEVSPFRLRRKPETVQSSPSDTPRLEVRSCSSGKQRRSRLPLGFRDRDAIPKMPCLSEEDSLMQSPPVRRSISTDRGTLRLKHEMPDNQPAVKVHFSTRLSVNKSLASVPVFPKSEHNTRNPPGQTYFMMPENVSENEQFTQELNIRQAAIHKTNLETKARVKHQVPTRKQIISAPPFLYAEEMGGNAEARTNIGLEAIKPHQDFARISRDLEHRGLPQTMASLNAEKNHNKIQNGVVQYGKEGRNTVIPNFQRSRSTPRGKFTNLQ
ncbi:hypothetical protein ACHQM5_017836 [Ranunculus cassubicifolius]